MLLFQFINRTCSRWMSGVEPQQTDGEIKITEVLKTKFPGHKEVKVEDISGIQVSNEKHKVLGQKIRYHLISP